jgi:hypothetical protein
LTNQFESKTNPEPSHSHKKNLLYHKKILKISQKSQQKKKLKISRNVQKTFETPQPRPHDHIPVTHVDSITVSTLAHTTKGEEK